MSELEPTRTYSNPTATDVLRRLLDERGVEWRYKDERTTYWYGTLDGEEWGEWTATEMGGHLHLTFSANGDVVTPEQAIAATLGTGTCHPVISDNLTESEGTGDAWADCSECGHLLFVLTDPNSQVPNFCPNCGRRIEQ